jgi:copper transport protein
VWTQLRIYSCARVTLLLWPRGALEYRPNRWIAGLAIPAIAVTFTGTGHAVTEALWQRAGDAVHVLAAGAWVGGLMVLAVGSTRGAQRPGLPAVARFSSVALAAVVVVVLTGTVNALVRLDRPTQLITTSYGQALCLKLVVLAAALGLAAASRSRLRRRGVGLWSSVRVEALATVAVVAVTAVLTSVAPPRTLTGPAAASTARPSRPQTSVVMELTDDARAVLRVGSDGSPGHSVGVRVLRNDGTPVRVRKVTMSATAIEGDVGPVPVPLSRSGRSWTGTFDPPLPGAWRIALTVEWPDRSAIVASGELAVS